MLLAQTLHADTKVLADGGAQESLFNEHECAMDGSMASMNNPTGEAKSGLGMGQRGDKVDHFLGLDLCVGLLEPDFQFPSKQQQ